MRLLRPAVTCLRRAGLLLKESATCGSSPALTCQRWCCGTGKLVTAGDSSDVANFVQFSSDHSHLSSREFLQSFQLWTNFIRLQTYPCASTIFNTVNWSLVEIWLIVWFFQRRWRRPTCQGSRKGPETTTVWKRSLGRRKCKRVRLYNYCTFGKEETFFLNLVQHLTPSLMLTLLLCLPSFQKKVACTLVASWKHALC